MRKTTQFFAHNFSSLADAGFSTDDYSKLKFGSNQSAKRLGYELADRFFITKCADKFNERFVVIPSPYNHVHNAATEMSNHFVNRLNYLFSCNKYKNSVEWDIIHRKVSYINDYGFLSKEDRKSLIDGDSFYLNKEFWSGKTLIFIDDVNITGTHEDKLVDILNENEVENDTYFLYFAKYTGTEANTEAALNFSYIHSVEKFIEMIKEEHDAKCLVRPIKYLMSQPEITFKVAISQLPTNYVEHLFFGCLAEGYDKIEKYNENFEFLKHFYESNIM
ncbi:putative orotate phosphoribosyltransferase [Klebsiella phage 05F01]|nr:putative orotate phosphoribosyltransferase [Klebsiella phage 05F01]